MVSNYSPHYQVQNSLVQTPPPINARASATHTSATATMQNASRNSCPPQQGQPATVGHSGRIGHVERLKMGILAAAGGVASIVTSPLTVGLGALFLAGYGIGELITPADRSVGSFLKETSALLGFGAIALPYCSYKAFESAYFGEKINILD